MKKTDFDRDLERELKEDPTLASEIQLADFAYDISMQIYEARTKKGYTQEKLAKLLNIKQSNIARLENGEYKGYSLVTLTKIAQALGSILTIQIVPAKESSAELYKYITSNDFKNKFQGIINDFVSYSYMTSSLRGNSWISKPRNTYLAGFSTDIELYGQIHDYKDLKIKTIPDEKTTESFNWMSTL